MGKQNNFKTAVNELMNGMLPDENPVEDSKPEKEIIQNKFDISTASSVIAEDMVIEGSVTGKSSMQIYGSVKGNVSIKGDVYVKGVVEGDIKGNNIRMNSGSIKGNLLVNKHVMVDNASVILGDISADDVEVDGKVKGNIKAGERVALKKAALVFGNVTGRSISIETGANLKGQLEIVSGNISEKDFKLNDKSTGLTDNREEAEEAEEIENNLEPEE